MFKPISFYIGLRYTRAKRNNHFISFIALVSMIGLTLGVAVLITVLSVMNGFDRELKNRVLGMVPQAAVASNQIIEDWPALAKQLEKQEHVQGVAPFTQLQGMVVSNGQVSGIMVSGIDPQYEKNVSIIQDFMYAGSVNALKDGEFGIIIGKKMADNLGLGLNDDVTIVLPEATPSPAGVVPRFKRFKVVGIFNVGAEVDALMGYIALNDAATLLRLPAGAQGIRLKLDDLFAAPEVAQKMVTDLNAKQAEQYPNVDASLLPHYYSSDWTQTHGSLFNAIQMEKTLVGLLLCMIVLVATFNIVSSLVMVVTDKKADIAILRTLGASPATITRIFMVQGTIIGIIGTVAGTVLGVVLSLTISDIIAFVVGLFGIEGVLDSYFIQYIPSYLRWLDVVVIVSVSLFFSFIATLYPALRASKIQPAEALRYE
ncbi:MAG: lipoprotein-releasing ABC transporter permease subunit [Acinetobacter sp.]|nr:lipoprotein-releasing ABC transporter permease subunit [Acinetobacter sp.]